MELNKLKFVGLDLSLTGTGVVCIDGNNKVIFSQLIQTKPTTKSKLQRILFIKDSIERLLNNPLNLPTLGYGVILEPYTEIIIEGFSYGSKGCAVYDLGMLGGIIRLFLFDSYTGLLGVDPTEYAPTFVKKFITGKGNAKKDLMIKEVYKLGFDTDDSNLADAFALAYMAKTIFLEKNGIEQKLNVNRKSLVVKYLKELIKDEATNTKNTRNKKMV